MAAQAKNLNSPATRQRRMQQSGGLLHRARVNRGWPTIKNAPLDESPRQVYTDTIPFGVTTEEFTKIQPIPQGIAVSFFLFT